MENKWLAEVGRSGFAWKVGIHMKDCWPSLFMDVEGGLHPKQDLFCISPGHVSPPSPSQIEEPMAVSVHAEESCGLWPAVPSLRNRRKIKSGLQEGIKQPHATFGLLLGGVSLGQDRGISLPQGEQGVSPLPPVSRGLGQSSAPWLCRSCCRAWGAGMRSPSWLAGIWAGQELPAVCVMPWAISLASLAQVVTPLSSLCLSQCHWTGLGPGDKQPQGCSMPQFPCL